jgi:hypothetical protein
MTPPKATRPPNLKTNEPRRQQPAAPPVYRPQPVPVVLQRKSAMPQRPNAAAAARIEVPRRPVHAAPTPAHPSAQPKAPARQKSPWPNAAPPHANAIAAVQQKRAQANAPATRRPAPKVVQAIKLYPNLHPGAVESVDTASVFKLSSFADQYRLRKTQGHGVYVPNQLYNFVRTSEGDTLLHNRYRHPSIAEGRQVLYAGEAFFNNGRLEWWSNGSGHYQPDSEDAQQAALPLDNFYSYQQVIKGEHKRKKA